MISFLAFLGGLWSGPCRQDWNGSPCRRPESFAAYLLVCSRSRPSATILTSGSASTEPN